MDKEQTRTLLSIIIPVYNVEKYIGKCLESCLNQDLPEEAYEIVVVNDGTPDNSMSVVEQFRYRHTNIRIVERENGGLSAARNTGLYVAKGEYIWFVDSDDTIAGNCLGYLLATATGKRLDVLCFGLSLIFPDGKADVFPINHEESGKVYKGILFLCNVSMPASACIALYRRDFLIDNGLRFIEGILHEDQEFTPRAYSLASRIAYLDRSLYCYYQRGGSIMKSSRNVKRCRDLLTIADSLYSFVQDNIEPNTCAFRHIMRKVYFCVTQSLAFYQREAFPLSEYREKPYFPMDVTLCKGALKRKLVLVNLSLPLYVFIHHFCRKINWAVKS